MTPDRWHDMDHVVLVIFENRSLDKPHAGTVEGDPPDRPRASKPPRRGEASYTRVAPLR